MEYTDRELSQELIDNAVELGLDFLPGSKSFSYQGFYIDLSSSASDRLSIMKNVAQQLVEKLKENLL